MTIPGMGNMPRPVTEGEADVGSFIPASILANEEAGVINISPKDPPPAKTLVYSPDVRILIARGNKQYDVSSDIVGWSCRRVENSVSSIVFKLANKDLRYNQLFERMDRVTMYLKRVEWVQVFSGYLDRVPHVQIYPGTVNFRASCTLKRLLHTWWDPGLPDSMGIFDQAGLNALESAGGEKMADMGLGSLLRRLLVEVGNWDTKNVHIQRFPMGYYTFMETQLRKLEPGNQKNTHEFKRLLLGDDTSGGVGAQAGRQLGVTRGGYVATAPERMIEVIRAVDEMGMGPDNRDLAVAQGLGVASQGGKDDKDQPAWQSHQEIGKNWTEAALKNDAAVHCFMTIMVESNWIMYANNAVPESLNFPHDAIGSDHDSVGLFQQRPSWGTVAQRMNPRESAGMFLQALNKLDWRNMDRGAACQAVQRSAFPGRYAAQEAAAVELVRALRTGTGTGMGTGGQSNGIPGLSLGGSPIGGIPSVLTAGAPGATAIPAIPTTNGSPSAAAAGELLGQPKFNTAGALSFARAQIGRPYVWGATGPASYDCSGLMLAAYRSIGIEIGRTTYDEAATCTTIPPTNLVPGDLIQPHDGHVVMWTGNGTVVHAPQTGDVVKEVPIYFDITGAKCLHVPGTEYGGVPFAPFDPTKAFSGGGAAPGTVAPGLGGGTAQVGPSEPIARNLFTYQFQAGRFQSTISGLYGTGQGQREKAFINDEPLMQTVVTFAKAGLRNFQSAPNGDFVAYYPDYFGLDGKGAVFNIEDVEMKNVQIDLNDDALATHVYVSGSAQPNGGGSGNPLGWLNSKGVATVENEWLFQNLIAAAPRVKGERRTSGADIMRKFGARPLVQSMASIQQGPMEFLCAMQIFMTKWAEQYSTQIETTFMPEVFPGMRLNLVGHNLQVYVTEVVHSGDWENGFTTQMTIMAPSTPSIVKLASDISRAVEQERMDQTDLDTNASVVM
ncbi:minor tail protein [Mycobacterium phage Erdmann]|nr:minor tail protein [Mycobacterium phage Erdmann]